MLRHVLRPVVILAAASMMGCSASSSGSAVWPFASSGNRAQLAAYAATATYPTDVKATDDWRAAAVVDTHHDTVRIENFSDRPMTEVNVWIDGNFVQQVANIPPRGSVTLRESDFYDHVGDPMSKTTTTPNRVEVQAGNHLYTLLGPIMD